MSVFIACIAAAAVDGDSIRCKNVGQVRLLGIDAPDRTSSRPCREGFGDHVCNDALTRRAKIAMQQALSLGPVRVDPVGKDRYGRTLAIAYAGKVNLNCRMLRAPGVRYIRSYDNGGRVRRACGL